MEFVVQYLFWVVFFLLLALILPRVIPVPDTLVKQFGPAAAKHPQFYSFTSNFVSVFHAVVTFVVSIILLSISGVDYMRANTPEQTSLFAFSCGYFTIDFIFGIIHKYNDTPTHFHHICTTSSFIYGLVKARYGDNLLWALTMTEISNPFLLLSRNFEMIPKLQHLAFPLSLIFAGVFIFARTYLANYFISGMMVSQVSLYLKLNCAFLCFLKRVYFAVLGLCHRAQTDQRISQYL